MIKINRYSLHEGNVYLFPTVQGAPVPMACLQIHKLEWMSEDRDSKLKYAEFMAAPSYDESILHVDDCVFLEYNSTSFLLHHILLLSLGFAYDNGMYVISSKRNNTNLCVYLKPKNDGYVLDREANMLSASIRVPKITSLDELQNLFRRQYKPLEVNLRKCNRALQIITGIKGYINRLKAHIEKQGCIFHSQVPHVLSDGYNMPMPDEDCFLILDYAMHIGEIELEFNYDDVIYKIKNKV